MKKNRIATDRPFLATAAVNAAVKNWPSKFVGRDEVERFFSGAVTNTQAVVLEIWAGLEYDKHLTRAIQEEEGFRPIRAKHHGRDGWTAASLAMFVEQHPDWIGQSRALADEHDAKQRAQSWK